LVGAVEERIREASWALSPPHKASVNNEVFVIEIALLSFVVRPKAKSASYKWAVVFSSLAGAGPYVELIWSHHLHHPLAFALISVEVLYCINWQSVVVALAHFKGQKEFCGDLWVQVFVANWAVNEEVELLFVYQFLDVLFVRCVLLRAVKEAVLRRVPFLLTSLLAAFYLRFVYRARLHLLIAFPTISL